MLEAYSVAVKLSLINQISPALALISRHFAQTHADAEKLKGTLKEIKLLTLAGGALAGAGFLGLGLISKTIKPASEYAHQLALMNTAGMKHLEIVKATQAAWAATKTVPTASVTENLEAIRDLRMVFGDTSHATAFFPTLQKIQAMLSVTRWGQHGGMRAEAYELAKALEMKGAVRTPSQFEEQADMMTKALIAAGGKVRATDFLSAYKYGRIATAGWSNDFAYKILPTLIQEMKGGGGSATGGPGSALMSAYAAVVGGTVSQRALKLWNQLGLIDKNKIEWTKVGEAKGIRPGGVLGSAEFQQNPYAWTQKYLAPALARAGYLTEEQQKQAVQYLFPNRTAGFVMSQFLTQSWKFERDRKLIEGAQGLGGYQQLLQNDPVAARMALAKQWEGLLAIIGYQLLPTLVRWTLRGVSALTALSNTMQKHSTLTKTLVWGFTALSAAMAFGGTMILLNAAFKGLALVVGPLVAIASGSSIAALATRLGPVGLAGAAGAAGYAIGSLINKLLGIEHGELGSWLWDKTHRADGSSIFYQGDHMYGKKPGSTAVHTTVNLDGKKVAENVTYHQAKAMSSPRSSITRPDSSMSLAYPGLVY